MRRVGVEVGGGEEACGGQEHVSEKAEPLGAIGGVEVGVL